MEFLLQDQLIEYCSPTEPLNLLMISCHSKTTQNKTTHEENLSTNSIVMLFKIYIKPKTSKLAIDQSE